MGSTIRFFGLAGITLALPLIVFGVVAYLAGLNRLLVAVLLMAGAGAFALGTQAFTRGSDRMVNARTNKDPIRRTLQDRCFDVPVLGEAVRSISDYFNPPRYRCADAKDKAREKK